MKTPKQAMAEFERKQMLTVLRGYRPGVPIGWTQEQWTEMLQGLLERAKKAGVTDEEIKALGFKATTEEPRT